jgi:hypothetical protein
MWRRSVWWIGANVSGRHATGLVQGGRVSHAEVTGTVSEEGGMLRFSPKRLFCGLEWEREEIKSDSKECDLNGTKLHAVLNKVTFF